MHELSAMERSTLALRQQLLSNNATLQAAGTSFAGRLEEVQEVALLQHKVAAARKVGGRHARERVTGTDGWGDVHGGFMDLGCGGRGSGWAVCGLCKEASLASPNFPNAAALGCRLSVWHCKCWCCVPGRPST
jgi:hypothetical protein